MPEIPTKETHEEARKIFDQFPKIGPPRPASFLEWSGVTQMTAVLAVICAVAVGFLLSWAVTQPTLEEARALVGSGQDPQATVQVLTQLREAHTKNHQEMFQAVVLSVLVPLFTLLAGYVFGRSRATGPAESEP